MTKRRNVLVNQQVNDNLKRGRVLSRVEVFRKAMQARVFHSLCESCISLGMGKAAAFRSNIIELQQRSMLQCLLRGKSRESGGMQHFLLQAVGIMGGKPRCVLADIVFYVFVVKGGRVGAHLVNTVEHLPVQ